MKEPTVSIVTAARNAEDSIGITLRSVNEQSYPHIQHVIIDGASTDQTVDVVSRVGARNSVVVSEPDSGVYDAFNKGLAVCTGDIVGFLNAGDEYVNGEAIQAIIDEFDESGADTVFADLLIVDPVVRNRVVRRFHSSQFRRSRARYGFMPAHPTLFVRRLVYEVHGGYDASYKIAGDFELTTRLFVRNTVSYSYLPQFLVRMPSGGLSTRGLASNWTITREMLRACRDNSVETSLPRLLLRFPVKFFNLRSLPV